MQKREIFAAGKVIGEYETATLLRDVVWGEPIIRAAVTCAKKEEYFTISVEYEEFLEVVDMVQDLLSRAAQSGVFDLALFDESGCVTSLVHWYMPLASSENEPDSEVSPGEVVFVEISPLVAFLDPAVDPSKTGRKPELLTDFARLIGCVPQEGDLLETFVDEEGRLPPVNIYLWRR